MTDQAKTLAIRPRKQLIQIPNGIEPYLETLPREQARAPSPSASLPVPQSAF